MLIREITEQWEQKSLSPYARLVQNSRGRQVIEEKCTIRTEFQRDRDRIIHSKAFRRLKHKTQVFVAPEGDHYRTRLTHTLEVAQIARTIARALRLNEDLTEAIALGHDIGHTPFGHAGEYELNRLYSPGFTHNTQSLRVVDQLEQGKHGKGLNLTAEVRDGILCHTGEQEPFTLEGQIVRIADRIGYINHDIDDALRAGVITEADLPSSCQAVLGETHSARIDTMVKDMITSSWEKPAIRMSPAIAEAMAGLRDYLFANVYIGSRAKSEESKAKRVVRELYYYFCENPAEMPASLLTDQTDTERAVCDYIAGMTDRYAMNLYRQLFLPVGWNIY